MAWEAPATLRGAPHLLLRGIRPSVEDVLPHRPGEKPSVLQHDAEGAPQAGARIVTDVRPVDQDRARGDLVEAGEQVDDGGLARARPAHDGRDASRGRAEADPLAAPGTSGR